jgi:hypothetical protein
MTAAHRATADLAPSTASHNAKICAKSVALVMTAVVMWLSLIAILTVV